MTSRERLYTVIFGKIPDHVPVAPDTSNMIPAKLTGKPFWDIYLYQDPPIWKAYIDCVKYFGFDSLMDGYASIEFADLSPDPNPYERTAIVFKDDDRIVTQAYNRANDHYQWDKKVTVYYRDNPPSRVSPEAAHLPDEPRSFTDVEGVRKWPTGGELLAMVKSELGEHGLVGVSCGRSCLIGSEQEIYDYYDDPAPFYERRDKILEHSEKKFKKLISLPQPPDFICTGASGTLVFQTVEAFRQLGLPIVKQMTRLAREAGLPSHIHSCGPEKELVKILAEETDLTIVDPLEIPPMGDCDLREIKRLYGHKLVLKGNLHTTNVMLRGTPDEVTEAAKRAIDDAAEGGGFILSTGDQCGRDTPFENIEALIKTAETYGRY